MEYPIDRSEQLGRSFERAAAFGNAMPFLSDVRGPERSPERDKSKEVLVSPLSEKQQQTVIDIGRFRLVALYDLTRFLFNKVDSYAHRELGILRRKGLVRVENIPGRDKQWEVAMLTERGVRTAKWNTSGTGQQFYDWLRRDDSLDHDLAMYRVYYSELCSLAEQGIRVLRVILEDELKSRMFSVLNKLGDYRSPEYQQRKQELARQMELPFVAENGVNKLQFPDLRLELEHPDGRRGKVDVELTTGHYTARQIAAKTQAGFRLYSSHGLEVHSCHTNSRGHLPLFAASAHRGFNRHSFSR